MCTLGALCCVCLGAAILCAVVCCGVLLRRAVFRGAVLPCGAMLLCCAVCFPLLRAVVVPLSFKKQLLFLSGFRTIYEK